MLRPFSCSSEQGTHFCLRSARIPSECCRGYTTWRTSPTRSTPTHPAGGVNARTLSQPFTLRKCVESCPRKSKSNTMDIWETLGLAFGSVCVFVVLHMAIFLLVRWMYPPTVMPAPMVLPTPAPVPAPLPPPTMAAPPPPAEPPLPEYYTQPAKKENAEANSVTVPMAPSSQEGATNIADL